MGHGAHGEVPTQRTQYSSIKEYALNNRGLNLMIYAAKKLPRNGRKNGGRKSIGAVVSSCGGLRQSRYRPPRRFLAEKGWAMEVGLSGALNLNNLTLINPISLKPCDSKAFRRLKELPMQQNSLKSLRALEYVIQPRSRPPDYYSL